MTGEVTSVFSAGFWLLRVTPWSPPVSVGLSTKEVSSVKVKPLEDVIKIAASVFISTGSSRLGYSVYVCVWCAWQAA